MSERALCVVCCSTPCLYCLITLGQWALELLLKTPSLPLGSGQWNCFCTLPHCLALPHCPSGQWVLEFLQFAASVRWGSVELYPFCALPYCPGAVTAAESLPYTPSLPWGSGQWNCF